MALVSLHNLSIGFGGPNLLEGAAVNIEQGDRVAVTGRNGAGKSTLLKIIAGIIAPDTGEVLRQSGLTLAYLSQDVPEDRSGTALEVARSASAQGRRVEEHLSKLGVPEDSAFNSLSGGMRRRCLLAGALAGDPQLLLLDEPTNHLDVESIAWLENWLAKARCACLFVTHDREFLKHVAKRVFDLDRGRLAGWDCDWPTFLKRKQELLDDEEVFWERKKQKLDEEERWIRRGVKARTRRNQGRVAALVKLREEFAQRRQRIGTSKMELGSSGMSGGVVVKAQNVTFGWPGAKTPAVLDFSAKILRGERVGVIGVNGAGKTTLLKLLCGKLEPQEGSVELGSNVEIAFFDQLRATLDVEATVLENVADGREFVNVNGQRRHVYGYLADFLFTSDRARTPVKALSGGERARLLLAKLFLAPGNLLVLDEPTNDLDVETLELLEEQIQAYPGTVLLVSHDRAFLDNVATTSFVFDGGGKISQWPGGYADWLAQRPQPVAEEPKKKTPAVREKPQTNRPGKLSYKEQREREELPERIDALEKEIAALNENLSDPEFLRDASAASSAHSRLLAANDELEAAVERWAELEERAEQHG